MKPIYRIRKCEDAKGMPMFRLEEGTKANWSRAMTVKHGARRWQIICLAYDLDILRGIKSDIREQTLEQHNAVRE